MKKGILLLLTILSIASCQKSKEVSKIVGVDWLLGKWVNKAQDGLLMETWEKRNDSLFEGKSFFIKEKDTLHSEIMQLQQKGENLIYISTIEGQNNNKPQHFVHKEENEKVWVFENPKNDYPKKIVYKPITKDQIVIEVSGNEEGKTISNQYSMKKME